MGDDKKQGTSGGTSSGSSGRSGKPKPVRTQTIAKNTRGGVTRRSGGPKKG